MSSTYSVITTIAADVGDTMVRLWRRNFDSLSEEQAEKKLQQFYLRNPAGSGAVFLLRHDQSNEDVGIQTIVARRFVGRAGLLSVGCLADFAVDISHRSLGPALQLVRTSVAQCSADHSILYGFPNPKSEAILRRAGLSPFLNMTRYVAVLRSRYYLERHWTSRLLGAASWFVDIGLMLVEWARVYRYARSIVWDDTTADEDIESIWRSATQGNCLLSDRSLAMLRWRFEASGSDSWKFEVARDRLTSKPLGYVVWQSRNGVVIVGDYLCADPERQTLSLMVSFLRIARQAGCNAISLEHGGSAAVAAALIGAGFHSRDCNPLYMWGGDALSQESNWYFTSFDRDTD